MGTYRVCVYVDGFNFYHQAVEDKSEFKIHYPSLRELCERKIASFPDKNHARAKIQIDKISLERIRYFWAIVDPAQKKDEQHRVRQENYISALQRAPENVDVCLGKFVDANRYQRNKGKDWKEKCSDVNLAAHIVNDAYEYNYNYAVIISNDFDFAGVIKLMKEKFKDNVVDVWAVGNTRLASITLSHQIGHNDVKELTTIANQKTNPYR